MLCRKDEPRTSCCCFRMSIFGFFKIFILGLCNKAVGESICCFNNSVGAHFRRTRIGISDPLWQRLDEDGYRPDHPSCSKIVRKARTLGNDISWRYVCSLTSSCTFGTRHEGVSLYRNLKKKACTECVKESVGITFINNIKIINYQIFQLLVFFDE